MIIGLVIDQVGEEKSKEILTMLKGLAGKMSDNKIYVLKKLPKRGVCIISTNSKDNYYQ